MTKKMLGLSFKVILLCMSKYFVITLRSIANLSNQNNNHHMLFQPVFGVSIHYDMYIYNNKCILTMSRIHSYNIHTPT